MEKLLQILILEDSQENADLIQQQLTEAKIIFEAKVVGTKEEFSAALESFVPDLIISDHPLPKLNSLEALNILKVRKYKVPFILVTSSVSQEFIVQIMKEGANDYILKDKLGNLPGAILNALEKHKLEVQSQKTIDDIMAKESLLSKIETLAHIGIWQHDLITDHVIWSDETFHIYGYTPGQITPSREVFLKSIHPDDQPTVRKAIEDALAGNDETLKISYRRLTPHNEIKYLHSELSFERDDKQRPVLITSFVQDITERKKGEESLQKSQANLLTILNNTNVSYVLMNAELKVVSFNQIAYDGFITFVNKELVEGKYIVDYFLEPEKENTLENCKKVLKGDEVNYENTYTFPDGTSIWYNTHLFPVKDNHNNVSGVIMALEDITPRKLSEMAILESEERYRLVAENPMLGIGWSTLEGKILKVNGALCKMLGNTGDELLNVYFGDFTSADDMEKELPLFEKLIRGEIPNYCIEKRFITKAKKNIWVELNISLVKNASGFKYLIGIIQNINDRKKAESDKEKITADLLQRNNDLEQFTYIVSHNLRAPVANIMGFSESLIEDGLKESETKQIAAALRDSVHRLDEVILDLNNILQVKSEFSEARELVKLSQIVDDIKVNNSFLIKKVNVVISSDFSVIDELFTIKSYIHSIFYNLISNSIKYRRADVPPVIDIKSSKINNKVILTFKDNGLGIDLNRRGKQVFGLYKRFHSHAEGKGVGLYMVKTQVETLGGKISIQSEVNKGTEFTIEFAV